MTMTDTILFVKETQTCHYVLHIATPRLCGEPGFRSRRDVRDEAYIRCREVVSPEQFAHADRSLPERAHPFKMPPRAPKPVIAPSPPTAEQDAAQDKDGVREKARQNEAIRKALEKLVAGGDLKAGEVTVIEDGDEEVIIEFIDYQDDGEFGAGAARSLQEMLRAAGVDIRMDKSSDEDEDKDEDEEQGESHRTNRDPYKRDEL
jgi:protein OS-9